MDNPAILKVIFLVVGIAFTGFGGLTLLSEHFRTAMYRTFWKSTEVDDKMFPGKSGYYYDRYVTGGAMLFIGIALLMLWAVSVVL